MKTRFPWIVLVAFACWVPGAVAQRPADSPALADARTTVSDRAYNQSTKVALGDRDAQSRVSLFREPAGKLILVVNYPWKVHARPSIEVRLLGQREPDDLKVQPMYFHWKYMRGKTTVAVYRCQDECEDAPTSVPVIKDDFDFEILGDRNSLGTPAVCVARDVVRQEATSRGGPPMGPGAAAAFPLLDSWAVNKGLVYLDLPENYFADAGRMRVWFLRDDRILWSETLAWPGLGSEAAQKRRAALADAAAPTKRPPSKPTPIAIPEPKVKPAPKTQPGPKVTPTKPRPRPEPKVRPQPRPKREPKPRPERKPKTKKPSKKKGAQQPEF